MKVFKKLAKAREEAQGKTVLMVRSGKDCFYFVGVDKLTEVALIASHGPYIGNIGLGHLNRLGNGNWAIPHAQYGTSTWDFDGNRLSGRPIPSETKTTNFVEAVVGMTQHEPEDQ